MTRTTIRTFDGRTIEVETDAATVADVHPMMNAWADDPDGFLMVGEAVDNPGTWHALPGRNIAQMTFHDLGPAPEEPTDG